MSSDAAAARKRAAAKGARVEDVIVAQAHVQVALGRREEAKAAADRLVVRAPIPGQVLQIKYRVGEYYNPGGVDPLAILGDTRTLRVRMDVDERDVGRVKVGARGLATASAFPGATFEGTVAEVGHRMGARTPARTTPPSASTRRFSRSCSISMRAIASFPACVS